MFATDREGGGVTTRCGGLVPAGVAAMDGDAPAEGLVAVADA